MDSRREFLKKAAMLSGAASLHGLFPPSIQRAFAINPEPGTTFYDAEHVVILMQENRSFDHCFGSLRGVRGFNDPRAITLADKNLVWLQSTSKGETYAPFRLNMLDTPATWMGSLPHGWTDQTDARNLGRFDKWLDSKRSGHPEFHDMPLTLGYYNREDLPFYYSLADAFTVCDQNFCSTLTGTTSNRLHLWTGTNRDNPQAIARVRNEEMDDDSEASWKTFSERLEENGISWKIYQNEISVGVGFQGEEDAWLSNFGDNPIEWFTQYNVRFHPEYIKFLPDKIKGLRAEIDALEEKLKSTGLEKKVVDQTTARLAKAKKDLETSLVEVEKYTLENYAKLSPHEKSLHEKAFVTNRVDPDYHSLADLTYHDGDKERTMKVPKGDVLRQFRDDVNKGTLPMVSWLVAPENFSDHPTAPWYGAWYLSESMDILTKNPEVWKKTIFILCYDENDGYFDHVPPFVAPVPGDPSTGKVSSGLETTAEYLSLDDDSKRKASQWARGGPVGLGYRVPLVIASPWCRGGAVCSQVFDHTSILQFLEKFVNKKSGKSVEESNISSWRRTVCGDLTSVFKPYNGENIPLPKFLARDEFVEGIHKAQFKKALTKQPALTRQQIDQANRKATGSVLPKQEKGTRVSRALPYELYASGKLSDDRKMFEVRLEAGKKVFGDDSAGSAFQIRWLSKDLVVRDYAVKAGDVLTDSLDASPGYEVSVYGPNGFYRQFKGGASDPSMDISVDYQLASGKPTGNVVFTLRNQTAKAVDVKIRDNAYHGKTQTKKIAAKSTEIPVLDLRESKGWYDISILISGLPKFEQRFAGRVETGNEGVSDPAMG